jgi:hypothetical protein
VARGEERWTGYALAVAVLDVRLFSSYEREREVQTSASARISGLPAAIARSPAVTVSDRSSCASWEYVERVLLAARGRRGRAGGGGS